MEAQKIEAITPFIAYSPEQQAVIESVRGRLVDDQFISYRYSDRIFIRNGIQYFAVFDSTAREFCISQKGNNPLDPQLLIDFEGGCAYEYMPVFIDGKCVERIPYESESGMLYLIRCLALEGQSLENPKWSAFFMPTRWFFTNEIVSNEEIMDQLEDEVESGENVFAAKPAGWA